MLNENKLPQLLEALLLAAGKPLREEDMLAIFAEHERPSKGVLREALKNLQESCEARGIRLLEIASGYQFQVNSEWAPWVAKLWEERAPRYSRALLETLALIAYRQPITRGEIEDIRGVSISQSIFKTLLEEREWIRVVGHKEVPGKPALYATTKSFLDYFGLKALEDLPSLPDIMNMENLAEMQDEKVEALMQKALHDDQQLNLNLQPLETVEEDLLEENLQVEAAEEENAEEEQDEEEFNAEEDLAEINEFEEMDEDEEELEEDDEEFEEEDEFSNQHYEPVTKKNSGKNKPKATGDFYDEVDSPDFELADAKSEY